MMLIQSCLKITILSLMLIGLSYYMKEDSITIYLAGDSTMADYADNYDPGKDYYKTRYPVTGWGQVFEEEFKQKTNTVIPLLKNDSGVKIDNRARGGRSTRTFFEEGRWRKIYKDLKEGDIVMIQFGHNDGAQNKPERYVSPEGYQEYLRLFIHQTKEKKATPVLLTPVCRNYPWKNGRLQNAHDIYPKMVKKVAKETNCFLIDLNELSMHSFSLSGREFVTNHFYMNLPPGKYEAYPKGANDNTHFQRAGAKAVSRLVYEAFINLGK